MTIDNCTHCDMCIHKNVCGKTSEYNELIARTENRLSDAYCRSIDEVLEEMNACITLTCLDYVREVKVREL